MIYCFKTEDGKGNNTIKSNSKNNNKNNRNNRIANNNNNNYDDEVLCHRLIYATKYTALV